MADIYRTVSNVVIGSRPRCEQPWVQATPSIMRDICRAVSNEVTGSLPTISIMRSGNPIYELQYEFKLQCHLLEILSHHFDNNGFSSRETVNIKYYINNSGIWDQPDICLWKIPNCLAILRLRKPLKTSTRLAGHGIWTRDLQNASIVHYQVATSLGKCIFNTLPIHIFIRN